MCKGNISGGLSDLFYGPNDQGDPFVISGSTPSQGNINRTAANYAAQTGTTNGPGTAGPTPITAAQNLTSATSNPTSYLNTLEQQGLQQYQPGQAPGLNMGAYGPVQTAQFNPQLMGQLQAQMNGQGAANQALNASAMAQLKAGTQANIASQAAMAAGQRGNQNPGAAQYNLANQASNANQQASGQLANTLASNQAALSGQATSALTQASQSNMQAANQMALANQANAQAGNQAQQNQYQYGSSLAAQQQLALNSQIAAMAGAGQQQAYNQSNAMTSGAIQGGASALGAMGSMGGGSSAAATAGGAAGDILSPEDPLLYAASGGVIDEPTTVHVAEHGPEAIVPLDGSQGDPHVFLEAMRQHYAAGNEGVAVPHMQGLALEDMLRSPARGRK
jgi:hypothetical protein